MEPFVLNEDGQSVLYYIEKWMEQYPELTGGFTSRHGGVSRTPFASLNCGLHVGDLSEDVVANRERLADALQLPFEAFTYAEQVHSNEVVVVTAKDKGKGRASRESAIQAKDAFVTNERGIVLCLQFADCVPLYFFDPVKGVIALAHAGWKGTVLKISMDTVSTMTHTFGSDPKHIRAVIGPSIGACCYEVDGKVIERVNEVLMELDADSVTRHQVVQSKDNGKFMLSLQELNRNLLLEAGILSSHIEISQLCTSCRVESFFSHRKEGGSTGRMVAWLSIR